MRIGPSPAGFAGTGWVRAFPDRIGAVPRASA